MASLGTFDIGDAPALTFTVANSAGVAGNATGFAVTVRPVGGIAVTYTFQTDAALTNPSAGSYVLQLPTLTTSGPRDVRAVSTGTNAAAVQTSFTVRPLNTA